MMKKIMLVCMMGIMAIVFSACPTPEENNKTKKNEPLTVTQLIQKSIWENDSVSDCGKDANANNGNNAKFMYLFDTEGKYYSASFAILHTAHVKIPTCSTTSGWPATLTRAQYLTTGKASVLGGAKQTYRVSGNTITKVITNNLGSDENTMTYSASDGGKLTNDANGKVYTPVDKGWGE